MKRSVLRAVLVGLVVAGPALLAAPALGRRTDMTEWFDWLPGVGAASDAAAADMAERWDLPVRHTDRVAYWERVLAGPRREKMKQWLEQSGRYVPMIRAELRRRDMPGDLVYLALIESGFTPNARSEAQAVGLWQLMAGTGRLFGLRVTPFVDERRDPVAATDAALGFLQELHNEFGSWWLAAAAYNCGPGRVERTLREVTGRTRGGDDTYWQIASHLPKETQDYVPLMLAAGEVAKDPARFGFSDLDYRAPMQYDSVRVPGGTRLVTVSRATGADSAVVDQLNPHYLRDITPPGAEWTVRIPPGLRQAFATNFPHLYALQRRADAQADARARAVAARLAAVERERAAAQRRAEARARAAHRHAVHHTVHHTTHHHKRHRRR